ncbi:flavin reductase family protein [Tyzzerella sp. OttesenSCG-928-J15]|nr:flavin reductase family protein [Tyzzerella sp. OttesenSCG-928-J15]
MDNWMSHMDKVMESLKTGAFLTVQNSDKVNTMTISWGYAGIMWNKPYFMALVRKSRYTHTLIDSASSFTVSLPEKGSMANELKICGTKSGRDINKSEVVKFIPSEKVESPVVDGCTMYFECEINFRQELNAANIPAEVMEQHYGGNGEDVHELFFGEIVSYYKK